MKVPKARKLSSGNYYIHMRLGGQSISITKPTEKEAVRAAELLKAEYRNGKKLTSSADFTLTEAIDKYIERRINVCSPASVRGWRTIQKNRFATAMKKPISSPQNWQAIVNAEAGLCSAKTIKTAFGFICSVMRENDIDPPTVQLPQVVKNPREFLDADEIKIFVDAVKGKPCEMAALLALHSLRRSELLALDKKSVDIKSGSITVKGAVVPDENGNYVKKRTNKNQSSSRIVPIIIPRLAELVERAPSGQLVKTHPECVARQINRVCKQANLPLVGVHGLRHSFASLALVHLNLSEHEVMEIGGWSDQATMHRIYTHVSGKNKSQAANKLTAFFSSEN